MKDLVQRRIVLVFEMAPFVKNSAVAIKIACTNSLDASAKEAGVERLHVHAFPLRGSATPIYVHIAALPSTHLL